MNAGVKAPGLRRADTDGFVCQIIQDPMVASQPDTIVFGSILLPDPFGIYPDTLIFEAMHNTGQLLKGMLVQNNYDGLPAAPAP